MVVKQMRKRITTKQRRARRKNIAVARAAKSRSGAISVKRARFKRQGLSYSSNWETFIKKNQKVISSKVSRIKKSVSIIKDSKAREKIFKNDMRAYKIELTDLWSSYKPKKRK